MTQPEFSTFNDVKIRIVTAKHLVRTEREFAAVKRRVDDLGIGFFGKRGATNLLFLEEGSGTLFSLKDDFNDIATNCKSFRSAYWQVFRGFNQVEATQLTQLFEQTPMTRFIRIGQQDGLAAYQSFQQAYLYGIYTAVDSMVRKGVAVKVEAEQPTNTRRQLNEYGGSSITEWREWAHLIQQVNVDFSDQLMQVVQKYPQRSRIMAIMGTLHASTGEFLPPSIRPFSRIVRMFPDEPLPASAKLLSYLLDSNKTNQEIEKQLRAVASEQSNDRAYALRCVNNMQKFN